MPSHFCQFLSQTNWFPPDLLITLAIFIPLSSHKPHRNRWAQEEQWQSWSTHAFHSCTFSSHWQISKFKHSSFYTHVKKLDGCRDVKGVGGISPVYLQLTKTLSSTSEDGWGDHLSCYRVGAVLPSFQFLLSRELFQHNASEGTHPLPGEWPWQEPKLWLDSKENWTSIWFAHIGPD